MVLLEEREALFDVLAGRQEENQVSKTCSTHQKCKYKYLPILIILLAAVICTPCTAHSSSVPVC